MNTNVGSLRYHESWLTRIWRRDLFNGLGYATLATFVLMLGWGLDGIAATLQTYGFDEAMRRTGKFLVFEMHHQLPMVPKLTIAVNLAPASGWKRYLCLGLAGVAMWGFCTLLYAISGEFTANSDYGIMVALKIRVSDELDLSHQVNYVKCVSATDATARQRLQAML